MNLSAAFDQAVNLIPIYDHPYKGKPEYRRHPWEERLAKGLEASEFSSIVMRRDGNELFVEAQNDKYCCTPRALAVMIGIAVELAPEEVQTFHLAIVNNGIPAVSMAATRKDVACLSQKI